MEDMKRGKPIDDGYGERFIQGRYLGPCLFWLQDGCAKIQGIDKELAEIAEDIE